MKAKLKSANGFTRFMLAHGEKLGMTAVVAVALLLIWKSLGRERLAADKQPSDLSAKAQQATTKVSSMRRDAFPPEEIVDGEGHPVASGRIKPIDPLVLGKISELNPYPINRAGKRKDPELLALEKLEVSSGSGILISADENVIKRAKIEALKQEQEAARLAEEERMAAEADGGDGGRRGGPGGGRRGRGGDSGGGPGRGRGGTMVGDGALTKDGALVVRPTGGVPLQGYEEFRNTSWVIVKAKVPIRAQYKMYDEALLSARGYNATNDFPRYKGYRVQRAEVTEAGDGKWTTIASVTPSTLVKAMVTWPIQTPDLINPKFNHPLLTYPLPPMVLRSWDASVTHSELPLPGPEDFMMEGEGAPVRRPDRQPEGEGDGDVFQEATRRPVQPGLYGGEGGGPGRGFPGRGGGDSGGGRGFPGGGRYGGGGGGDSGGGPRGGGVSLGMMGGGEGGQGYDEAQFENFAWDQQTQYLLFRYIDSKVEPGKRYRYRVSLVLQDVNAAPSESNPLGIQEMYLENDVIERRKAENRTYRMTDWSEPSPVAIVPQAGLVFVASAQPANATNFNAEPAAQLLIKTLDNRAAAEVALAEMFTRGSVLNLMGKHAKLMWSSKFEAVDRNDEPVESPAFDFRTGLTLLDMDGGEPLNGSRTLTGPARAMLMDSAGRLTIHRELNDSTPVREYNAYMEMAAEQIKQEREREAGGGRGGDSGGGGPRGGGGRGGGGRGGGG